MRFSVLLLIVACLFGGAVAGPKGGHGGRLLRHNRGPIVTLPVPISAKNPVVGYPQFPPQFPPQVPIQAPPPPPPKAAPAPAPAAPMVIQGSNVETVAPAINLGQQTLPAQSLAPTKSQYTVPVSKNHVQTVRQPYVQTILQPYKQQITRQAQPIIQPYNTRVIQPVFQQRVQPVFQPYVSELDPFQPQWQPAVQNKDVQLPPQSEAPETLPVLTLPAQQIQQQPQQPLQQFPQQPQKF